MLCVGFFFLARYCNLGYRAPGARRAPSFGQPTNAMLGFLIHLPIAQLFFPKKGKNCPKIVIHPSYSSLLSFISVSFQYVLISPWMEKLQPLWARRNTLNWKFVHLKLCNDSLHAFCMLWDELERNVYSPFSF